VPDGVLFGGHVMADVVVRLSGPIAHASDTPAHIEVCGGGAAANSAAWFAALGGRAGLFAAVGADAFAAAALAGLGDVDRLVATVAGPTGTCVVLVTADGERTMLVDPGANARLGEVVAPSLAGWPTLHLSGYLLLDGATRDAALRLLSDARAHGNGVVVDAASAAPLRRAGEENFLDWIGRCLVLANHEEAMGLAQTADPEQAARVIAGRCGEAVVKCGPDGAWWSDGVAALHEPAAQVAVLDTTGAGDAFAAGYLHARAAGPRQALQAGHRTAARTLRETGARPR
jgi:sugar/nucleoside kinase (ribokinase family)